MSRDTLCDCGVFRTAAVPPLLRGCEGKLTCLRTYSVEGANTWDTHIDVISYP